MSIQERTNTLSCQKTILFKLKKKYEIMIELREIGVKFRCNSLVNKVKELLEHEMHGI